MVIIEESSSRIEAIPIEPSYLDILKAVLVMNQLLAETNKVLIEHLSRPPLIYRPQKPSLGEEGRV